MVREYEAMYILRPDMDEENINTAIDHVQELFATESGEIMKSTRWGRRHLSYEIEGFQEGFYVIDRFTTEGSAIREIERNLHIDERVLRHLIVLSETTRDITLGEGLHGEHEDEEGRDRRDDDRRTPRARREERDDTEDEEE